MLDHAEGATGELLERRALKFVGRCVAGLVALVVGAVGFGHRDLALD